jgi:hypothetical protein
MATAIATACFFHAFQLLKNSFGTPETTVGKGGCFEAFII